MIGQYEMSRDDDIIRVWSTPVFNLEAAQQYARDMMEMIDRMPPRFGTLVEFAEPPIIGPEVEEAMRRSVRHRAARGMVAVAFVTRSLEALGVAAAQWHRIYDGSGVTFRFFAELEPARTWLRGQIEGRADSVERPQGPMS
jgi:hypothetical protein